ncbi:hypothetical protein DAEQUDRAFT_387282 [Daedalea quercina L-15889]|uniref:Uncharacterized protein n=1 Tax=Daedalea quercina L-15889 TaxID=1314783 RepID=A0A165NXJ2_9APHY|nr:hypothetical protein DAEQUDRAFT_387282 [Daedalea quercina L-15889]
MLNRLHSRLFHPMIHLGYGLEFGLPGLVAEGLAQTAVHPLEVLYYFPPALYQNVVPDSVHSTSAQERISLSKSSANSAARRDCPSIFTILARVQADDSLSPSSLCLSSQVDPTRGFDYYCQVGGLSCEALASHAQDWEVNPGDTQAVTHAIEELSFLNALLYGVCGWRIQHTQTPYEFKADFYLMHTLTSSIFLPTYAASLRPSSVSLLLKTYLLSSLTWWVARGRPNVPIREIYYRTNPTLANSPIHIRARIIHGVHLSKMQLPTLMIICARCSVHYFTSQRCTATGQPDTHRSWGQARRDNRWSRPCRRHTVHTRCSVNR